MMRESEIDRAGALLRLLADSLDRTPGEVARVLAYPGLSVEIRKFVTAAADGQTWRRCHRVAEIVRNTPKHERWMVNEHAVRFEAFLTAYEAYKRGDPQPKRSAMAGFVEWIRHYYKQEAKAREHRKHRPTRRFKR